jgi:drug/metabolite transporter (DMT)-like permease
MQKLTLRVILAFLAVYLFWGGTYVAIKLGLESFPPMLLAGTRHFTAGLFMLSVALFRKDAFPKAKEMMFSALIGLMMLLIGNGLVTLTEQTVPSSIVSLLIGAVPLWIIVLNWSFGDKKRPTIYHLLGVTLGLIGIAFLVFQSQQDGITHFDPLGIFLILVAAISWAAGSLVSRYAPIPKSPYMNLSFQMLSGGFALFIASFIRQEWVGFDVMKVTTNAWISLGYLIFFGSILGYSAYIWLLRNVNPTWVSTYAFVNPVVAVFLGWLLAKESLSINALIAAAIIIISIVFMTFPFKKKAYSLK